MINSPATEQDIHKQTLSSWYECEATSSCKDRALPQRKKCNLYPEPLNQNARYHESSQSKVTPVIQSINSSNASTQARTGILIRDPPANHPPLHHVHHPHSQAPSLPPLPSLGRLNVALRRILSIHTELFSISVTCSGLTELPRRLLPFELPPAPSGSCRLKLNAPVCALCLLPPPPSPPPPP